MQEFVIAISDYARSMDADFIVIPQNGIELAFQEGEPESGFTAEYMNAIDGVGIESLFYEEILLAEDERLPMAREIAQSKKVLVSDYLNNNDNYTDAVVRSKTEGFLCFPRLSENYDYMYIPSSVMDENENDILTLQQAKNYLYLINTDGFESKGALISALAATNYDVILIDPEFAEEPLTASEVTQLKTKANGHKRLVISYLNIGAAENWRWYWKKKWNTVHPCWMKRKYDGYKDERWVKFWDKEWKEIIYGNENSYLKRILDAGFDGVYLDNVEAYYFLYYRN